MTVSDLSLLVVLDQFGEVIEVNGKTFLSEDYEVEQALESDPWACAFEVDIDVGSLYKRGASAEAEAQKQMYLERKYEGD